MKNKKGSARFIIVLAITALIAGVIAFAAVKKLASSHNDDRTLKQKLTDTYPKCPANLEGILTKPFIDPKNLTAITPLGNLNPPGHTSPVDHNYFSSDYKEKIPVYAPADNWIDSITVIMAKKDGDADYKPLWFTLNHQLCDGLVLTFANYTDLIQPIKDIISKQRNECKFGIKKSGHDFTEGQCYHRLSYKVKAGELIGWTQYEPEKDGAIPFEIWAANYNKEPISHVNWEYYQDERYAHIMCTFDLYKGTLKDDYYKKFGRWSSSKGFTPREVGPLCGLVNQDKVGTIQGMWFGRKPKERETVEEEGNGLAFVHDNLDPGIPVISVGGIFTKGKPNQIFVNSKQSGVIDRDFNEVTADGKVYCYNTDTRFDGTGKILVQLVDSNHLKVEYQDGECGDSESFKSPYSFER